MFTHPAASIVDSGFVSERYTPLLHFQVTVSDVLNFATFVTVIYDVVVALGIVNSQFAEFVDVSNTPLCTTVIGQPVRIGRSGKNNTLMLCLSKDQFQQ